MMDASVQAKLRGSVCSKQINRACKHQVLKYLLSSSVRCHSDMAGPMLFLKRGVNF